MLIVTGEETSSDGGPRTSAGRAGHAQQRTRPGDGAVLTDAAGGRVGGRGRRRLLHMSRGIQVSAHQGTLNDDAMQIIMPHINKH